MKCRHCQFEIADHVKFCPECGKQVTMEQKNTLSDDTLRGTKTSHRQRMPHFLNLKRRGKVIILITITVVIFLFGIGAWWFNRRETPSAKQVLAKLLHENAKKGCAFSQNDLGCFYLNGSGVAKDEKEAVIWYCKAAEQGVAAAQYNLGLCYKNGFGIARDKQEAAKWYCKAAEQGDTGAINALKSLY